MQSHLSYVDVPTVEAGLAIERVKDAADSGELWTRLYPEDAEGDSEYSLLETKMTFLDISGLPQEHSMETLLPL